MNQIGNIVYATDFSDLSAYAFEYAVLLAQKCQARLHCVHVVDDSYQYWTTVEMTAVPAGPPIEELVAAARTQLALFVEGKLPADLTVVRAVLRGRPFMEIIQYARQEQADMIVLGTHGRSALRQVLMGSVADKVVHKSHCPVLTVRHPGHSFEMP